MKLKQIFQSGLGVLMLISTIMLGSCISDGEETYVLEDPVKKASKMIVGGWRNSSATVTDEDGNEVTGSELEDIAGNIPEIEFGETGDYTIKYPGSGNTEGGSGSGNQGSGNNQGGGHTESGKWYISDDESTLYLGNDAWEIFSFGENKLIIMLDYEYKGKLYYIILVFDKTSSPETNDEEEGEGEEEGNGAIPGNNNPYKPYNSKYLISKITINSKYANDISGLIEKDTYQFKYDKKYRIMEYTGQYEQYANNNYYHTTTHKYNFKYDDNKIYLYIDETLFVTGVIGSNGYLTKVYSYDSENVIGTFKHDNDGFVTYIKVENKLQPEWYPKYENYGDNKRITSSTTDYPVFTYSDFNNLASIDLNGLIHNCYAWEVAMYDDRILSLFDFFGKRTNWLIYGIENGYHLTDINCFQVEEPEFAFIPTMIEYTYPNGDVITYQIEYIDQATN